MVTEHLIKLSIYMYQQIQELYKGTKTWPKQCSFQPLPLYCNLSVRRKTSSIAFQGSIDEMDHKSSILLPSALAKHLATDTTTNWYMRVRFAVNSSLFVDQLLTRAPLGGTYPRDLTFQREMHFILAYTILFCGKSGHKL